MLLGLLASLRVAAANGPSTAPDPSIDGLAAAIFRHRAERGAPPPVTPPAPPSPPAPPATPAPDPRASPAERLALKALDWPVRASHSVSSSFGYRHHPILRRRAFHNGIDLAAPVGTAVIAPADGVITRIGEDPISGRFVTIDHGDGVATTFTHLHGLPGVPIGTPIRRGQRFATVGNTGRSTGPHLHYIVRVDGVALDPTLTRARAKAAAVASAR